MVFLYFTPPNGSIDNKCGKLYVFCVSEIKMKMYRHNKVKTSNFQEFLHMCMKDKHLSAACGMQR